MKPWQFHFGQKVCSWYPGQPPAQWNTDGKSKETQKPRWDNNEIRKKKWTQKWGQIDEIWRTVLESLIIFVVSTLPLSGQQWQWFVAPLLHFWENPAIHPSLSATQLLPDISSENIFTEIFLPENLAKIFLGRKLVKALISSEDNQTMGNFHLKGKSRRTNFMQNKSWQKMTGAELSAPIIWKAENFLKKNQSQESGEKNMSGQESWKAEFASWKQNVISWWGAWIRKVAFPLQKLRITGSSTRPQQLERKN